MVIIWLILLIFILAFIWVRHRYSYFEKHGIPYDPPSFPMGNLKGIGGKVHPALMFQKFYMKFKGKAPVCGLFMFLKPNVIVTDLDAVKDILIKNFEYFRNRGVYYNTEDDPLTGHLLAIEDNHWKNMRSKLSPTFTSGKMKMMFGTVLDIADHMIENLQKSAGLELEVKDMLANFTTEVIGNVAFGLDMNSISDPKAQFRVMGKKLFDPENNFLPKLLFLASNRELGRKLHMKLIPTDLSDFFLGSIRKTIEYRIKNNIERNDFLNLVIKMYTGEDMESGGLTFNELAAQCFIFFIGGFETSSSTSTFVLYHLAMNQDIQEKLREEIKKVAEKNKGKITYEGIKEMKYLQMVIDETLRMQGPVPILIRAASRDYPVPNSNIVLEKGSQAIIPIYAIHHDPENYPDPENFNPERFSEENKAKRHPMAFIPFGDGPRNCIGLRFGLMQTKIAIVKLLLNFSLKPISKTPKQVVFHPKIGVLAPIDGMWLKMEKI